MTTAASSTVEQRKQRWCDFYDMAKPPQHLFLFYYNDGTTPGMPAPYPENKQERIDWAWDNYERQLKRIEWLDDDWVPYANVYTGTEIFAEAFGCGVHRPENNNPCAIPMITKASEVSKLEVPGLDSPPLAMLFDMADELHRRGGPGTTLKMVDIQSPMDIAAQIWDKNTFYLGIIESPEAIKELAAKTNQLLTAFLDEWFSRYGDAFVAHYPEYYFPRGITLSEDDRFLRDVKISGPSSLVAEIGKTIKVKATVSLPGDELEQRADKGESAAEARFLDLPEELTIEASTTTVRLTVTRRGE